MEFGTTLNLYLSFVLLDVVVIYRPAMEIVEAHSGGEQEEPQLSNLDIKLLEML